MSEQPPPGPPQPPSSAEMSREEKIAAARAKAEAMKAQRAAPTPAPAGAGPTAPRPAAAQGVPGRATAVNPGGAPPAAPQHPKVEALGTITQSVEFRADPSEAQNLERLLGGLGLYRNPLRGAWQLDYRPKRAGGSRPRGTRWRAATTWAAPSSSGPRTRGAGRGSEPPTNLPAPRLPPAWGAGGGHTISIASPKL